METTPSAAAKTPAMPPTMPVAIKKESDSKAPAHGLYGAHSSLRKDSLSMGWGADDFLGMITHTPPAFSPGSLTMPMVKRGRSGSISSRLLSATDLEERGLIDRHQKGILKDLIISGDEALQRALEKFDAGDPSTLEAMLDSGALNRKSSIDLLDDLDLGFLNVGSLGETPKDEQFPAAVAARGHSVDEWDELNFEAAFHDMSTRDVLDSDFYSSSLGASLPNSLPSMGLGITPPASFSFVDDFMDSKMKDEAEGNGSVKSESKLMGKPPVSASSAAATSSAASAGAAAAAASSALPSSSGSATAAAATTASSASPSSSAAMSTSRPIGIPGASNANANANRTFANPADAAAAAAASKDGAKKAFVGAYSPDSRRKRIEKFLDKRQKRVWRKEVKYDVRKNFADSRLRVKGRFVKKEDEQLLRELLSFT